MSSRSCGGNDTTDNFPDYPDVFNPGFSDGGHAPDPDAWPSFGDAASDADADADAGADAPGDADAEAD